MAIDGMLAGKSFSPEAVEAMGRAYEDALTSASRGRPGRLFSLDSRPDLGLGRMGQVSHPRIRLFYAYVLGR
jgi:hypothetical protein